MTLQMESPNYYLGLVDKSKGLVDRSIYSDADLYQVELERIFARCWNFMCHGSMIPNPGDFFLSFIGEDRVIVVRDNDGGVQALVNSCRHRGNAVCRAEEGHATSFMCTYHGWTYDLKGNLVGVPGFKEVYHEELDRENWGLITARVEEYKGWVFANFDQDAPSLHDYLGEVGRMGIDQIVARGDTMAVGGIQKWTIPCNWKFAVDNVWDYYHAAITHASSGMAGWRGGVIAKPGDDAPRRNPNQKYTSVLGEYGHTIGGPAVLPGQAPRPNALVDTSWREKPESEELLGEVGLRASGHPNLFPNLWIMTGFSKASLRLPKGPTTTEIWWFAFYNPEHDDERKVAGVRRQLRHDGPAGVFEQDDGENWGQSTIGTMGTIAGKYPLHYAMNLGRGEVIDDESGPPHIDTDNNEHSQLWFYHSWSEWMASETWDDLRAIHTKPEGTM